jgi:hypothetical protein
MKKSSTSLTVKEMQIKTLPRFHLSNQNGCHQETSQQILMRMAGSGDEPLYTAAGNIN